MGTRFRIYESHLNFPLQFLCDFGLYGCGLVELEDGWQRCSDDEDTAMVLKQSPHFRQSRLPLEIDVIAPQILNRHQLAPRNVAFKIGEAPPVIPDEPVVLSVRELWEDERSRRKAKGLNPSPELPIDPSDASRGKGGEWVAEARYWEGIRNRIQGEGVVDTILTQAQPWEGRVMTTFESIEALWEAPYKRWKPAPLPGKPVNGNNEEDATHREGAPEEVDSELPGIDVDISLISNEVDDEVDEDVTDILGKGGINEQDPLTDGEQPDDVEGDEVDDREETPEPVSESRSVL
jgi:DNA polymerase zeta